MFHMCFRRAGSLDSVRICHSMCSVCDTNSVAEKGLHKYVMCGCVMFVMRYICELKLGLAGQELGFWD